MDYIINILFHLNYRDSTIKNMLLNIIHFNIHTFLTMQNANKSATEKYSKLKIYEIPHLTHTYRIKQMKVLEILPLFIFKVESREKSFF